MGFLPAVGEGVEAVGGVEGVEGELAGGGAAGEGEVFEAGEHVGWQDELESCGGADDAFGVGVALGFVLELVGAVFCCFLAGEWVGFLGGHDRASM
ncbi:hypothetical protein HMPREF9593_01551, partial [Cutibacterium acnes HL046PA2]